MSFDDIINEVQRRPELWKTSHPYYRNRGIHMKSWKEIQLKLHADEKLIKKRWKHLKDQYRKELKKATVLNNGELPENLKSNWQHYPKMAFMKEEMLQSDSNRKGEVEKDSDSESQGVPDITEIPSPMKSLRRTRIQESKLSLMLKRMQTMNEMLEAKLKLDEDIPKNDTDYMFLVSLLPSMKSLTDIQKLHFRGKINDWLLEALTQNEYTNQCDNKMFLQSQITMHNEN